MESQPHPIYREVGQRIAALRKGRGLTQERLAEAAGIETSYLARIETGARRPTLDKLANIAALLRVPIANLFRDEQEKPDADALPPTLAKAIRGMAYPDVELLGQIAATIREQRTEYGELVKPKTVAKRRKK